MKCAQSRGTFRDLVEARLLPRDDTSIRLLETRVDPCLPPAPSLEWLSFDLPCNSVCQSGG